MADPDIPLMRYHVADPNIRLGGKLNVSQYVYFFSGGGTKVYGETGWPDFPPHGYATEHYHAQYSTQVFLQRIIKFQPNWEQMHSPMQNGTFDRTENLSHRQRKNNEF